ncbi:hypothetical protein FGO68_gene14719 [Halteria grandinella]|uniref:Uncharacterized protein n=1 Tax=Halteria grandinella TaxID=5974 RepID=A0A8J8T4H9_HALGN|nr:hypothetical protein FGO68_gene14719 [Halteria grandinella]
MSLSCYHLFQLPLSLPLPSNPPYSNSLYPNKSVPFLPFPRNPSKFTFSPLLSLCLVFSRAYANCSSRVFLLVLLLLLYQLF